MADNETLTLVEGENTISIATTAPEVPDVETIKLALTDSDASISSEAFETYLNDAIAGTVYDVATEAESISMLSANTSAAGMAHFSNIPLNYTFYKTFSFTKDQDVFISATSPTEHNLDVVFYGTPRNIAIHDSIIFNPHPIITPINSNLVKPGSVNPGIIGSINPKLLLLYNPATSEEMQGLNWTHLSEKSINSSTYMSTIRMKIPKSGMYLVRLRTSTNGVSSVADLNVNGSYFYENVPMTLAKVNCAIPADGNEYATMTCCDNFGTDDPFLLFMERGADRIVGFNDDAPSAKANQYNLSSWDSYISQKYFMPTSGISVSNYSSSKPTSKCSIIARVCENSSVNAAQMTAKMKRAKTTDVSPITSLDQIISIPSSVDLHSSLTINASTKIKTVSVYTISGTNLARIKVEDNFLSVLVSELNISQTGIYIINVETVEGITSQKTIVK